MDKGSRWDGKDTCVMRKLKRRDKLQKDEILYVCENEGIANQVR